MDPSTVGHDHAGHPTLPALASANMNTATVGLVFISGTAKISTRNPKWSY
ncbi:hypothetical protein [Halapricum desulfuricans]|nr:hypothetical protein [Halapricum desulfuricans]